MRIELPEGLKFMELSLEKEAYLWDRFSRIHGMFDDFNKNNRDSFRRNLFSPNSLWLETIDETGVLYLLNIIPGLSASAHFVFFDETLRGREELCKAAMRFAMQNIPLRKINVWLPSYVYALRRFIKRCGLTTEGKLRRWSIHDGKFFDIIAHGILYEEAMSDGTVLRSDNNGKATIRPGIRRPGVELLSESDDPDGSSSGRGINQSSDRQDERTERTVRTGDGEVPVRDDAGRGPSEPRTDNSGAASTDCEGSGGHSSTGSEQRDSSAIDRDDESSREGIGNVSESSEP